MSDPRRWVPTLPEISRETLTVIAGALIAAVIVSQVPAVRAWMERNGVRFPV